MKIGLHIVSVPSGTGRSPLRSAAVENSMTETKSFPTSLRVLVGVLLVCALGVGALGGLRNRATWSRGEALRVALLPLIGQTKTDQSLVDGVILRNDTE